MDTDELTLTGEQLVSEIELFLSQNPDPEIPCQVYHNLTGTTCSGPARWHRIPPCGCRKNVCQNNKDHIDTHDRTRPQGGWRCMDCSTSYPYGSIRWIRLGGW